jgi:hypothetical protein
MSNQLKPKADPNLLVIYQIRLKGHLGQQWAASFEGLTLTLEENGDTLLSGPVTDQAALHGLLRNVRDGGMLVLSIKRLDSRTRETHGSNPR